jgi:hypothetical protein
MKLQDLEDGATVATKADLRDLRTELQSLKLDVREARLEAREQYNRFRLLIWLPIVTGALQVLAAILHH